MSRSLIDVTLQCLYRFYTIFYRLVKIVTHLVVLNCEFCVVTNAVLCYAILTVIKFVIYTGNGQTIIRLHSMFRIFHQEI
jgi:hypothetical protein